MNIEADRTLRQALQSLPQEQAPEQLWSRIEQQLGTATVVQLKPRRSVRSWAPWIALAAGVMALALTLNLNQTPVSLPDSSAATLAALQEQSRKLEQRLATLRSHDTRYSARAARLEQSLADGLALTDLQLSVASDTQISTQLWQRRVALLSTWLDLNAMGGELGAASTAHGPEPTPSGEDRTQTQEEWL